MDIQEVFNHRLDDICAGFDMDSEEIEDLRAKVTFTSAADLRELAASQSMEHNPIYRKGMEIIERAGLGSYGYGITHSIDTAGFDEGQVRDGLCAEIGHLVYRYFSEKRGLTYEPDANLVISEMYDQAGMLHGDTNYPLPLIQINKMFGEIWTKIPSDVREEKFMEMLDECDPSKAGDDVDIFKHCVYAAKRDIERFGIPIQQVAGYYFVQLIGKANGDYDLLLNALNRALRDPNISLDNHEQFYDGVAQLI